MIVATMELPTHSLFSIVDRQNLYNTGGRCKQSSNTSEPLSNLKILDVGCGAGLLCEPLARLGADVIGIDAVQENINCAKEHAAKDPIGN